MDSQALILIAARASLVYFVWLFGLRLLSRRSFDSLTALDLLIVVFMAEALDEVLVGTLPLWKGVLMVASVAVWHLANAWFLRAGVGHKTLALVPNQSKRADWPVAEGVEVHGTRSVLPGDEGTAEAREGVEPGSPGRP